MKLVSPSLTSSLSSSQPPCRSKIAAAAAAAVEIAVRPVYNFEKWGPTGAGKHLLRLFLQVQTSVVLLVNDGRGVAGGCRFYWM